MFIVVWRLSSNARAVKCYFIHIDLTSCSPDRQRLATVTQDRPIDQ